ncbi:DUF3153 domain-containing protein [Synechococcus sp. CS-1327]|nr:DUF3153 domain-containing protein [Synechococcus sp. CS-1326]MCT0232244.1 DUF3153 domain-containing protein [Synechococcus sp. CS-1327]
MPASARCCWGAPRRSMAEDPLLPARSALERGDYGVCLRLLEPLALAHPASSGFGGSLRLLMVTALLGQGQDAAATACCRSLRVCQDPEIRSQARDLQLILEAPPLQRPANWSLTLPVLNGSDALQGRLRASASVRRSVSHRPAPPPSPPVGPTRGPVGFAVVVVTLLLLLTTLLSGCLRVETELRFGAPGRLQLQQTLSSESTRPLPWQRAFVQGLKALPMAPGTGLAITTEQGVVRLSSASLSGPALADLLALSTATAAELGGLTLPPPGLFLRERNWLLGARQRFGLEVDLRQLADLPGLDLSVVLGPLSPQAVRLAQPLAAEPRADGVRWPLQIGALNSLELSCWRWSRLGLGVLAILLLLSLALALQRLRWQAGFGWPELPSPDRTQS